MRSFKKNVTRAVEDWKSSLGDLGKKLSKNAEEIDKLEAIKSPTADDKNRLETCKKTRDKLRLEVEQANSSLKTQIIVLTATLPDKTKANEKDLIALPDVVKKLIKDKGVEVLKGVVIAPTVDIDFKGKKLNSFGIKITW